MTRVFLAYQIGESVERVRAEKETLAESIGLLLSILENVKSRGEVNYWLISSQNTKPIAQYDLME